ncbi:hypothetical protein JCM10213v2_000411 [Rhodosporidiobolus nylandii]
MDSLSPSFLQLPALPPSPAASTSSGSRRKRSASPTEELEKPVKKRPARSTAAEKAARKTARMERNRIAAQASRDRKKQHSELLEARVAELEAQLAVANSSSSAPAPPPFSTQLALPSPPTLALDPAVEQLKEENEALKTQLALEKLQSQALQIRLSSLEAKFGRLEQLLSSASPSGGQAAATTAHTKVVEPEQNLEQVKAAKSMDADTDSSRLVAREVELSLQRKLSHPSSTRLPRTLSRISPSTFPSPPSPSTLPPSPSLSISNLGAADAQDDLAQAWADWANGLDAGSFEQPQPRQVCGTTGEEFDLFGFLRQDAAMGAAAEVGC